MYRGSSPQIAPRPASRAFEIVTSATRAAYRLPMPDQVRFHSSGVFHAVCQALERTPTESERGPRLPSPIHPSRWLELIGTYTPFTGADACASDSRGATSASCANADRETTLETSVMTAALIISVSYARSPGE